MDNNVYVLGLPVILSPYEVQLLLEKNVISLLSKKGLLSQPTEEQQLQFTNFQSSNLNGQHEFLRANKINESTKFIGEIMRGKEKKLLKSGVKKEDIHLKKEDILNDIGNSYDYNDDNALIQVPTEHPFDVGKSNSTATSFYTYVLKGKGLIQRDSGRPTDGSFLTKCKVQT